MTRGSSATTEVVADWWGASNYAKEAAMITVTVDTGEVNGTAGVLGQPPERPGPQELLAMFGRTP